MEKVHNFLYPSPIPKDVLDFFEFGKIGKALSDFVTFKKRGILDIEFTIKGRCLVVVEGAL